MSTHCQEVIGCIEIMDNVFIGSNTIILGNVRIGPNVIVAAGSVINRDVPPGTIVGGVPAKVIGDFDAYAEKRKQQLYPQELAPRRQMLSGQLSSYLWRCFVENRTTEGKAQI